jgi:hypothetical protein
MYNWIPLSDETDPQRPAFLAEGYINDPLMVLPRYWDKDAALHLDTVRQIGKQAAEEALRTARWSWNIMTLSANPGSERSQG